MVTVENVTTVPISTMEELNSIIQKGSERRHTAGTQMNEESSRSHLILSVVIESVNLQSQSSARGKVLVFLHLCITIYIYIYIYVIIPYSFFMHHFET
jgi:hypothetical protein